MHSYENDRTLLLYPGYIIDHISCSRHSGTTCQPLNNNHSGVVSCKAARRIRKAISWLNAISPWTMETNPTTKSALPFKLSFLTLTLCAPQMHTDQEIKYKMLHPWLTHMCRKYKIKSYLWRAEPQANGNIHFHFVCNKFMNLFVVRRSWNASLKRLGYVEAYRQRQKAWHNGTFRARPELFKTWSKEQQQKAYTHGVATNWSDPNSTDLHSLHKVENVDAYLSKYLCKNESAREIKGRLWFISRSLSDIKPLKIQRSAQVNTELYIANKFNETGIEINEFATLYKVKPAAIPVYAGSFLRSAFVSYCKSLYSLSEGFAIPVLPPPPKLPEKKVIHFVPQSTFSFIT